MTDTRKWKLEAAYGKPYRTRYFKTQSAALDAACKALEKDSGRVIRCVEMGGFSRFTLALGMKTGGSLIGLIGGAYDHTTRTAFFNRVDHMNARGVKA